MLLCVLSHSVVSDSLQSCGLQPVRLLCPWDFSGKNTGVSCISYSRRSSWPRGPTCISSFSCSLLLEPPWEAPCQSLGCVRLFATPWAVASSLISPWNSPGKNTGVGCCHALRQGIFPTQGPNLGLLHCRQILHSLSHHGCPKEKGSFGTWTWNLSCLRHEPYTVEQSASFPGEEGVLLLLSIYLISILWTCILRAVSTMKSRQSGGIQVTSTLKSWATESLCYPQWSLV